MKAAPDLSTVRNVKRVSNKKFADIGVQSLIGDERSIAFFLDRKEWRHLKKIIITLFSHNRF